LRRLLSERYRERLAGVLSCYDRIIVTGTLPGVCYAKGMTAFLSARQIRIFDYPRFAEPLRDRLRERAAELAAVLPALIALVRGSPVQGEAATLGHQCCVRPGTSAIRAVNVALSSS
jgi:hypothetical protein